MPNEIPRELLDEMMSMTSEQWDHIEQKWIKNLSVKSEYERQYYNQLPGYLDYNSTFKEKQRPLKPHEYAAVTDYDLLKEAKEINIENARHAAHQKAIQKQQERDALVKSFVKEKEQILNVEKVSEKLQEKAPELPLEKTKENPTEKSVPLQLENPAPPHVSKEIQDITDRLFAGLKYEAMELEYETRLNYPANDLRPHDLDIELER